MPSLLPLSLPARAELLNPAGSESALVLAPRRPPLARPRRDGLSPVALKAVVLGTLAVHGLAVWALMQVDSVREVAIEAMPIFVSLFDAPAQIAPSLATPPRPVVPPTAPSPRPLPAPAQAKPAPAPPATSVVPLVTAAPQPAPAATQQPWSEVSAPSATAVAPAPWPAAATPALPTTASLAAASVTSPAPATPAAPRQIPASAVRYLEPPAPVYPRQSIRMNESGTVSLRVFIDEAGLPRTVQITRSSGAQRLDEAALAAVQKARFHPPTENGQPISGWARIDIPFELEK